MAAGTDLQSRIEQCNLIDNGVSRSKLERPWISAKENKVVCGGFGIGCEVVGCRMLGKNEALFPPH